MKSVYFRKILLVFIAVMFLANALLLSAYFFFGKQTYIDLEIEDMTSTLNTVQRFYLNRSSVFLNAQSFVSVLSFIEMTSDVNIYYYAYGSNLIINNIPQNDYIIEVVERIISGESVTVVDTDVELTAGSTSICIAAPLYNSSYGIEGCVLIVRNTEHIDSAFDKLNSVLWVMAAFMFPIWIIAGYFSAQRLSKPMRDMTNIAIQVTNGNYDVRANENLKGEMGIFARAMNRMSEEISKTIFQLNSEKRQLSYILSSFSEGVAAIDEFGHLTHYNPALMRMFGTVDVKVPLDLVPDRSIWDAFHAVIDSKEPRSLKYDLPGDRMLWISIVPVISDDDACIGAVGLFKDMSEMEKLERMRRDYVANISHELRTPLTAVRGLLEPLVDGMIKDDATKERYYSIMLKEVERLSRLITDMLQLSRLQSGTEYMEVKSFDINILLDDIMQSYKNEAANRGLSLALISQQMPQVISDPDRIEQVIVILLDNAMRYTAQGGNIEISTREDLHFVYVCVSDTGCGISEEDLPHIFERFYKADKSRKEGGTGLGLSIAKHIMDKLGEELTVESKVNEGTCFQISIKKYVPNAIALGPIEEAPLIEPETVSQPAPKMEDGDVAHFEVIESTKPKKRKT
ncbi:MAG: ATP-binding protein [Clostridia bacterium]|nr:ATP-binding protein [Clostridia bacterium]